MKFELPDKKKQVHRMTIPIRWGDMDAMGHVNNTVYFRYLETIRIEWMQSIGCQPDPRGEGPVMLMAKSGSPSGPRTATPMHRTPTESSSSSMLNPRARASAWAARMLSGPPNIYWELRPSRRGGRFEPLVR